MRFILTLVIVLCASVSVRAQTLVDKVPAEAVVYVGWRGTTDLGANFAGSHAEALLKESQISVLIDQTLPALATFAGQKDRNVGMVIEGARKVLTQTLRYPTALYVAPGDDQSGGVPRFGLLCKPEKDAQNLLAEFGRLASMLPPEARARALTDGQIVALLIGYPADAIPLAGGENRPAAIADDAAFKAAMQKVGADPAGKVDGDPVLAAYINVKHIVTTVKSLMPPQAKDDPEFKKVEKLLSELGLDSVESAAVTATFKNRNWSQRVFVDAKSKRGLLSLLESKPFNAELLARVPASSVSMSAMRFDPNKLINEVRRAANAADPEWGDLVKQVIGGATLAIGANLENEILDPLGDEWVSYCSPEIAGTDMFGMVLVNKLDKPMDAKTGLAALSIFLSNTGKTLTQKQDFKLSAEMIRVEDMNVFYAALPVIAPAWTIKDGYLYVGFYPQSVVAAAKYKGPGIAEKPEYAETMTRLEQAGAVAITFMDVKAKMPEGYGTVRMLSRTVLGLSDMFAVKTPEMILPPLPSLLRESGPAASIFWADESGVHGRSVEPFPLSTTIANMSMTNLWAGNPAMAASILLPSLNRSREAANRIKSASNLRQIGLACLMFANENRNRMPDDFEDILRTQDITAEVFVSPRTATEVPVVPPGDEGKKALGEWVNTKSDYVYLGKGLKTNANADSIVAYEKPDGLQDGINVLFLDGHVEFIAFQMLEEVFKASNAPMPEMHR